MNFELIDKITKAILVSGIGMFAGIFIGLFIDAVKGKERRSSVLAAVIVVALIAIAGSVIV